MASSPTPTTPENAPRRTFLNRSVTAPTRTSPNTAKPPPEIGATEGVETLYTHPNASIIKFTTLSSRPSSSSPGRQQGGPALLPWTSLTERTVAAGPLSVYRVPGSVSFLNSGNLLHAILPRSQCWCVDGVSKFALRVLPDTYYRIELPGSTEEDKEEVERLKVTLQKVCFYERTPCPFERGFDVEIKDEPDLEVRKKRRKSHGPAKKWKLDRQHSWKPEGWQPDEHTESGDETSTAGSEDESGSTDGVEDSAAEEMGGNSTLKAREIKPVTPSRVRAARNLLEQRSVTAPVVPLAGQATPPSRLRTRVDVDGTVEVAEPTVEGASERESAPIRTFQAIPTDMPPSPPDSSAGIEQADFEQIPERLSEPSEAPVFEGAREEEEDVQQELEEGDDTVVIHDIESEYNDPPTRDDGGEDDGASQEESTFIAGQTPDEQEVAAIVDAQASPPIKTYSSTAPAFDERETATLQNTQVSPPTELAQPPSTPPPRAATPERRASGPFVADSPPKPLDSPSPSPSKSHAKPEPDDPFAAIQARILARRSIGGTITSFQPPPTRQSTSSSSSNATSTSSLSRRSQSNSRQQQAFATAMVKKACSVFLGPPAHLVAIMLRIAARFAKGTFGVDSMFYVESPREMRGMVPGSYQVLASGEVVGEEVDEEVLEEWEEDDFGVPLRSPVRLASMSSLRSGSGGTEGLRERVAEGGKWIEHDSMI